MPTYIVPTEGNAALAAGRLALAGIQSIANFRPGGRTSARLKAETADAARERVEAALGDGFAVSEPYVQPEEAHGGVKEALTDDRPRR